MSDDETTSPENENMGITFSEAESGSSILLPNIMLNENKINVIQNHIDEESIESNTTNSSESGAELENAYDVDDDPEQSEWAYKINASMSDNTDVESIKSERSVHSISSVRSSHDEQPTNLNQSESKIPTMENADKDRRWYIRKFQELKRKGIQIRNFNTDSSLEEMKDEYEDLVYEQKKKNGISLQKNVLVTVVSLVEMANTRYDPFKLDLKGWSESFHENIHSMDEILEELYEKYYDQFMFNQMPVEARLIVTVAFSALSFHFTKAYLTPERMRNIQKAKEDVQPKTMPAPSTGVEGELLEEWIKKEKDRVPTMSELTKDLSPSRPKQTQRFKVNV